MDRGCDPISFSDCSWPECEHRVAEQPGHAVAQADRAMQRRKNTVGGQSLVQAAALSCGRCGKAIAETLII